MACDAGGLVSCLPVLIDAGASSVVIFRSTNNSTNGNAELSGFANFLAGGFGGMNTTKAGSLRNADLGECDDGHCCV